MDVDQPLPSCSALTTSLVLQTLPKIDENNSMDNKHPKERVVELLDLLEGHVETLRKEAAQLEEDRDQLLATLDTVRHADLLNQLDENDVDDVSRYADRIMNRCQTVEVRVLFIVCYYFFYQKFQKFQIFLIFQKYNQVMANSALPQSQEAEEALSKSYRTRLKDDVKDILENVEDQIDTTMGPGPAANVQTLHQPQNRPVVPQQFITTVMTTTTNGAANVIPTSPQYGVAIISSNSGSVVPATYPSTAAIISNSNKSGDDGKEIHSTPSRTNDRFKVVKIASLEPFKRGRWKCMDYVDEAPPPNVSKAANFPANIQTPTPQAIYIQSQSLPQQQIQQMLLQGNTQLFQNMPQLIPQGQYFYPNPQQQQMPNNNQFINTQPAYFANPAGFSLQQSYPNIQYVPIPAQNSAFVPTTQHYQQSQSYAGQPTMQASMMNGHNRYPQQNEPQGMCNQPSKTIIVNSNNNPPIQQQQQQQQQFQPPQSQIFQQQPQPAQTQNIIQPQSYQSQPNQQFAMNANTLTTVLDEAKVESGSTTATDNVEDPTKNNPVVNAIDNKIEQAMDLVKSHLMYTVREEVEVLKEKITELMERIQQLETENNYLRSQVPKNVAPPNNSNNTNFPQQQQNIAIVNPSPNVMTQHSPPQPIPNNTTNHQTGKESVQ